MTSTSTRRLIWARRNSPPWRRMLPRNLRNPLGAAKARDRRTRRFAAYRPLNPGRRSLRSRTCNPLEKNPERMCERPRNSRRGKNPQGGLIVSLPRRAQTDWNALEQFLARLWRCNRTRAKEMLHDSRGILLRDVNESEACRSRAPRRRVQRSIIYRSFRIVSKNSPTH